MPRQHQTGLAGIEEVESHFQRRDGCQAGFGIGRDNFSQYMTARGFDRATVRPDHIDKDRRRIMARRRERRGAVSAAHEDIAVTGFADLATV